MKHVISLSGGKDSTATALLAIALETTNVSYVFADTGNEHEITYEYLTYLENALSIKIETIKADFSRQIERKRNKLINGSLPGWSDSMKERALKVLQPTGIPFLDLCLWKGRFPSSRAQFCTQELKTNPIFEQVFFPLLDQDETVWSWQGIRREESKRRRYAKTFQEVGGGLYIHRPLAKWKVDSIFEAHDYMGIKPNPLYTMGMDRVGCFPCINCSKNELRSIALRAPEAVERVREWEHLVSMASKRGSSTFFTATDDPTVSNTDSIHYTTHGIDRRIEWSKTTRGGRLIDLLAITANPVACESAYGLCDGY